MLDIIGGREKKDRSDSRPVELLPSNKTLYLDKLNNEEEPDTTPAKCVNVDQVFKRFQPSVEVQLETAEGEEQAGTFDLNTLADFQADNLVGKNELLTKTFNEVEVLKDLVKQLGKNKSLLKALKDPEKKASFLKFLDSNIKRLG